MYAPQAKMDCGDPNSMTWSFTNRGEPNPSSIFDNVHPQYWHGSQFYNNQQNQQQRLPEQGAIHSQFSSHPFNTAAFVREPVHICMKCFLQLEQPSTESSRQSSAVEARLERLEHALNKVENVVDNVAHRLSEFESTDVPDKIESIKKGLDRFFDEFAAHLEQKDVEIASPVA
ncbi:hypothetical protein QQS21_002091 [Conoideocrella luteorostrata]|uniref:Uncharacterized protein n=1 Tax=Conoideocrella luteorostrata TaxID=1105319 RepID=A0AAJ0CYK1_9HYPO|nr:hypothetical protein QQS21_002091 [Conoideocrella luteorostrata]